MHVVLEVIQEAARGAVTVKLLIYIVKHSPKTEVLFVSSRA